MTGIFVDAFLINSRRSYSSDRRRFSPQMYLWNLYNSYFFCDHTYVLKRFRKNIKKYIKCDNRLKPKLNTRFCLNTQGMNI